MKLKDRLGQLFILGFKGTVLDANNPIIHDLHDNNLGGVILFDKLIAKQQDTNNISGPTQVKSLTDNLQQQAANPLLIAIDQEGGLVRRLKTDTGFPKTASAQKMGEVDDPLLTAIHASCTANTLNTLGINLNLSPSVDLNSYVNNPVIGKLERSFSADVDTVIRHAAIWIKEHRKRNILTCLKHFPGHGSSRTDSHLGFTDITETWQEEELTPFKSLIQQDLADCVMPGHLFHSGLDSDHPTSLSPAVIGNILRNSLGFEGLVITDDLQMKAITDQYGLAESVCLALAAGVDMLIIGNNLKYDPQILSKILSTVLTAVEDGRIPESRIYEALSRVENTKKRLGKTGE